MLVEAYFDESEGQVSRPRVITVAGFLFKSEQSMRFSRDAKKHLDRLGLSHFHQTDCANGNGEYASLSMAQRIKAQDLLRANIKRRALKACAANINLDDYQDIFKDYSRAPSAYSYALMGCMNIVRHWIETTGYVGDIAYFFEDGYKHKGDADGFVSELLSNPAAKADYRYISHAFEDKRKVKPLQAADMLAWYTNQEFTRIMRGELDRRKDFAALLRLQDTRIDHTRETLTDFRDVLINAGRI